MGNVLGHLALVAAIGAFAGAVPSGQDAFAAGYLRINLVSDGGAGGGGVNVKARFTDSQLQNPWGFSFQPGGPIWVSDNNSGLTTIYDGAGDIFTPSGGGNPGGFIIPGGAPTGQVSNTNRSIFKVPNAPGTAGTAAALFIFDSENGMITAWQPGDGQNAVTVVDNSATHAVYKGLAMGNTAAGAYLYATNFRQNRIEMYDSNFKLVKAFGDKTLPAGFAPFGISNIDGQLYVSFARQDAKKHDDVAGPGNGYVDVFDTDGRLVQHFAGGGTLNSPWGIARAPLGFGVASGDILVGNFGDGWIGAYKPDGTFAELLQTPTGNLVTISKLWAIQFADNQWGGAAAADPASLYFTAGPGNEQDGVFGMIRAAP